MLILEGIFYYQKKSLKKTTGRPDVICEFGCRGGSFVSFSVGGAVGVVRWSACWNLVLRYTPMLWSFYINYDFSSKTIIIFEYF
jgi:hypothetical protein